MTNTLRPRGGAVGRAMLAAALFGASTPASKALLGSLGPLQLAGLLYLGAALAVAPFARGGAPKAITADRKNRLRLAGAVIFGGGLGPVLMLLALQRAPAASLALWLNLETVATSVLAWSLFREHFDGRTWFAMALIFVASVLLAAPSSWGLAPAALFAAGAGICWGIDNNLTAVIDGYTPAFSTLVKGLVSGTTNLVLGLWLEGAVPGVGAVAGALVLGALAYGASIVLYVGAAQDLGASRSQMFFATAPFLGTGLAWWWLGEPVQSAQIGAAALMVTGLSALFTERHDHEHHHEAMTHVHPHRHDDGHHNHVHDGLAPETWHEHVHDHEAMTHRHPHVPDLHHRHEH